MAFGHSNKNWTETEKVESTITFIAQQKLRRMPTRPAFLAKQIAVIVFLFIRSGPLSGFGLGNSWFWSLSSSSERRHFRVRWIQERERKIEREGEWGFCERLKRRVKWKTREDKSGRGFQISAADGRILAPNPRVTTFIPSFD